ncbi:hypothetical protein BH18THE2_BH18THE2_17060 [soil metagenome]
MTNVSVSGSKEFFTNEYADPSICSYLYYPCAYCGEKFQLVEPDNDFRAGGAARTFQYRNPKTNEIKAAENRSVGVCLRCAQEIIKRQQQRMK